MFPSVLGSLALRSNIIPTVQSAFSYAMNLSLHLPPANVITAWLLIALIVSTFIVLPIIIINCIIVLVKSAIHYCNRHLHRSSTSNDDTIICPSTEKVLRSSQAFHGVCNPFVNDEVVPPVQTPPKKKMKKKMKKQSVTTPLLRIAAQSKSDRADKPRPPAPSIAVRPSTPAKTSDDKIEEMKDLLATQAKINVELAKQNVELRALLLDDKIEIEEDLLATQIKKDVELAKQIVEYQFCLIVEFQKINNEFLKQMQSWLQATVRKAD